jgi:anti-sigma B factor antagonist
MEPETSDPTGLMVGVSRGVDGEAVVAISGELDLGAAATLAGAIEEIVAGSPSSVLVDLADVSFLDSSGLGALLKLHARCQAEGIAFSATNPPSHVCRVLELTNLTELFNFH